MTGIRDYFRKSGFTRATLGLSGGIDSAVVAVLAVKALGAANVRVLLMPSPISSTHSVVDAIALAQNLGIAYDLIPIGEAVDSFTHALKPIFGDLPSDTTEENIQARTRGILLMALSNKFGHLVLNTSNKSECAVGYSTLWGHERRNRCPEHDLYKTESLPVGCLDQPRWGGHPPHALVKPPSAG